MYLSERLREAVWDDRECHTKMWRCAEQGLEEEA